MPPLGPPLAVRWKDLNWLMRWPSEAPISSGWLQSMSSTRTCIHWLGVGVRVNTPSVNPGSMQSVCGLSGCEMSASMRTKARHGSTFSITKAGRSSTRVSPLPEGGGCTSTTTTIGWLRCSSSACMPTHHGGG